MKRTPGQTRTGAGREDSKPVSRTRGGEPETPTGFPTDEAQSPAARPRGDSGLRDLRALNIDRAETELEEPTRLDSIREAGPVSDEEE